ncbi:Ras-related protein RABC2a [Linum perenne]
MTSSSSLNFSSASPPSTPSSRASPAFNDYSFKILMIGDSAVGKSSILLRFISDSDHHPSPTIGVDFKIKTVLVNDKRLKLTIWDTAGQERFGTLTTSYYRGAHGIILAYDVTNRETFTSLSEIWARDVELYSTNLDCVKLVVGNKVDKDSERAVSKEEGMALARQLQCSFLECTAKSRENVDELFSELIYKVNLRKLFLTIFEVPALLEKGSGVQKSSSIRADRQLSQKSRRNGCCSS